MSIFADNYLDYSKKFVFYLTTLQQPVEINLKKFNTLKKRL